MHPISVNFSRPAGPMKPLHGVNNGPVYKFTADQRITNLDAFQAAGIPYARTHDSSFCSNYGGEHTVDVHLIFRDFSRDPADPAAYDFAPDGRIPAGHSSFRHEGLLPPGLQDRTRAQEIRHAAAPGFSEMGSDLRAYHPPLHPRLGRRLFLRHRLLGDLERARRRGGRRRPREKNLLGRHPGAILRIFRCGGPAFEALLPG